MDHSISFLLPNFIKIGYKSQAFKRDKKLKKRLLLKLKIRVLIGSGIQKMENVGFLSEDENTFH